MSKLVVGTFVSLEPGLTLRRRVSPGLRDQRKAQVGGDELAHDGAEAFGRLLQLARAVSTEA